MMTMLRTNNNKSNNVCKKYGSHWIERVHFGDTFFRRSKFIYTSVSLSFFFLSLPFWHRARAFICTARFVKMLNSGGNSRRRRCTTTKRTNERSKVSIFQYQHFDIFSCHIFYSYMITLQRHNKRQRRRWQTQTKSRARLLATKRKWKKKIKNCEKK